MAEFSYTTPLFEALARGNPLEFWDEIWRQKTRIVGLPADSEENHDTSFLRFYRAMHFSAKRGIAIACRLSVRLSVCLSVTLVNCDHIG